jgi:hypothetical protein
VESRHNFFVLNKSQRKTFECPGIIKDKEEKDGERVICEKKVFDAIPPPQFQFYQTFSKLFQCDSRK